MNLTDFLLARIAEDEGVARAAAERPLRGDERYRLRSIYEPPPIQERVDGVRVSWYRSDDGWSGSDGGSFPAGQAHFEHFGPERVLAECEAKRRIVELHAGAHECSVYAKGEVDNCAWVESDETCSTLSLLALPYASHPDYDEAWKA